MIERSQHILLNPVGGFFERFRLFAYRRRWIYSTQL